MVISAQIDLAHRILSRDRLRKSPTVDRIPVSYEIFAERALLERIVVVGHSSKRALRLPLVRIVATSVGLPELVIALVDFVHGAQGLRFHVGSDALERGPWLILEILVDLPI